jgi:hypothetical protein
MYIACAASNLLRQHFAVTAYAQKLYTFLAMHSFAGISVIMFLEGRLATSVVV